MVSTKRLGNKCLCVLWAVLILEISALETCFVHLEKGSGFKMQLSVLLSISWLSPALRFGVSLYVAIIKLWRSLFGMCASLGKMSCDSMRGLLRERVCISLHITLSFIPMNCYYLYDFYTLTCGASVLRSCSAFWGVCNYGPYVLFPSVTVWWFINHLPIQLLIMNSSSITNDAVPERFSSLLMIAPLLSWIIWIVFKQVCGTATGPRPQLSRLRFILASILIHNVACPTSRELVSLEVPWKFMCRNYLLLWSYR